MEHYTANNKVKEKENIIKQDFSAENINEKWCTDITYIYTIQDAWTYLASVMDCYSKKIIGWSYSKSMTTEMALATVKKAILNVKTSGKIFFIPILAVSIPADCLKHILLNRI